MSHKDVTNVQPLDLQTVSVADLVTEVKAGLAALIAAGDTADKFVDLFDPALGEEIARGVAILTALQKVVGTA